MSDNTEITKLKAAIKNTPDNPEVWRELAAYLADHGQSQKALMAYRRSLELSGEKPAGLPAFEFLESLPLPNESLKDLKGSYRVEGLLKSFTLPLWFQVFLGLFSFLVMLLLSTTQNWSASDLVWSLWISSIVLGYSFILTSIIAINFADTDVSKFSGVISRLFADQQHVSVVLRIAGAIFMLLFFSFHFLFFHFVHSVFLNSFFPMANGDVFEVVGKGYFVNLIAVCIRRFWPFILVSALSQMGKYFNTFQRIDSSLLSQPYKNVVRMHLSIFAIAFLFIAGIESFALYVVLILYFFPVQELWNYLKTIRRSEEVPV